MKDLSKAKLAANHIPYKEIDNSSTTVNIGFQFYAAFKSLSLEYDFEGGGCGHFVLNNPADALVLVHQILDAYTKFKDLQTGDENGSV